MERNIWGSAAKYLAGRRRRLRWQRTVTALASVVVFCTTYVLILPAITLTVDEGWMNQLTETHVYINCPGEAQYETNSYVGTVSEDFGSADSGSGDSVDLGADDVPMAAVPEGFSPDEETGQAAQSDPSPPGGETGQATQPSHGGTVTRPDSDPEIPEQPEDPAGTDSPKQPEDPAGTDSPKQPEDPTGTDSPEQPEDSTGTDSPEQPEDPIKPETPVNPEQTIKPDDSTDPEQNNEPETPENPDSITDPENPTDPEKTDPEPAEPDGETDVGEAPKGEGLGEEPEALPGETEVPHEHDESCYDEEGNLTCGQDIPEAPLEETEGSHEHTDECYDEEGNLVCGLETEEPRIEYSHIHTEECFEMTEDGESVLICEEEGHVHSADCLDDNGEQVICGYEGYFPEDAKLVWVEIDKTFTFGIVRYTVTGQVKLPKGTTQDDFFDSLFSVRTYSAVQLSMGGEDAEMADEFTNEDKIAMLVFLVDNSDGDLTLTTQQIVSGELPHTGGVGLAVWYAAGGTLIAAAGLMRKKAEEEI